MRGGTGSFYTYQCILETPWVETWMRLFLVLRNVLLRGEGWFHTHSRDERTFVPQPQLQAPPAWVFWFRDLLLLGNDWQWRCVRLIPNTFLHSFSHQLQRRELCGLYLDLSKLHKPLLVHPSRRGVVVTINGATGVFCYNYLHVLSSHPSVLVRPFYLNFLSMEDSYWALWLQKRLGRYKIVIKQYSETSPSHDNHT